MVSKQNENSLDVKEHVTCTHMVDFAGLVTDVQIMSCNK